MTIESGGLDLGLVVMEPSDGGNGPVVEDDQSQVGFCGGDTIADWHAGIATEIDNGGEAGGGGFARTEIVKLARVSLGSGFWALGWGLGLYGGWELPKDGGDVGDAGAASSTSNF
ncbi:hypothetical protein RchiOBHm_Chr5g0027801 [Rosa chinensis]|uniref:Uncharacterized protein n=1 Tax=Rosa chinensis TaxID=74649 RepID=A0A2P6Q9A1_ROSCH|nr:hypothetical protein RchiOBHm_Chr5g0027801 [Rosa chinensis]